MSWFRRHLPPLEQRTLARDQEIIDLDRKLAEEHGAVRESARRLDRMLVQLGALFVESVRDMERGIGRER
jgi:hypothetical protein